MTSGDPWPAPSPFLDNTERRHIHAPLLLHAARLILVLLVLILVLSRIPN